MATCILVFDQYLTTIMDLNWHAKLAITGKKVEILVHFLAIVMIIHGCPFVYESKPRKIKRHAIRNFCCYH
jgi:hypothetical protein